MIGAFVVAGFILALGVFVVLVQVGATRLSRTPSHANRTQEES